MFEQSFGQYLLSMKRASGRLGDLAKAASRDPSFPRDGRPEDVAKLLRRHRALPEFHAAMQDAIAEWQSLN